MRRLSGGLRVRLRGQRPAALPQAGARINRGLRRSRTLLIAAAASLYVLARVFQATGVAHDSETDDAPTAILALMFACVLAAGVLTVVLRVRHRLRGWRHASISSLARDRGWHVSRSDSGELADRFPLLPLLASQRTSDRASTRRVVWGGVGDRLWWAVDQKGAVRDPSGLRHSTRRSTVVVLLPDMALPRIVVAGRDLVRVREWLGNSMLLESDQWNRRLWVWCDPDEARYAHAVLHPRAMEHLLSSLPDGMALVVAGDALAVWRDGPLIAPDLEAALSCAVGLADLLPGFLLNDYASSPKA